MADCLNFNEQGETCIECANCKRKHRMVRESAVAQTRLQHIFGWVMAAVRSQGYKEGFLCRKCEKKLGVDTSHVRKLCKKYLTLAYFEARKNVRVT